MNTIVVIGSGSIGQAIVRRVGSGNYIVLADILQENCSAAAKTLGDAGFDMSTAIVDISSRESLHSFVETVKKTGRPCGT
jgi:saccharopine dehydrogenase-like NADP-dependent oxidoreductase